MKNKPFDRRWKRSIVYTQLGKIVEEELTYDKFVSGLKQNWEYYFNYNNATIDIAFHYEDGKKIYELNINGYWDNAERYYFSSVDKLVDSKVIDGKSLSEIWEELEN